MPTVSETNQMLDYIAENPQDQRSQVALQKMGLQPIAIEAWKAAKENPLDPKAIKAKNKIFDTIAANLPAKNEMHDKVGFVDRFKIKNLIDRDPILQQKYLSQKGFDARVVDGRVQARLPGEPEYTEVDPTNFDMFDVFDVFGDLLEAAVTGIGTGAKALGALGAPVTGGASLAAGAAVGGALGAGFEAGKQTIAKGMGLREEYDPNRIVQQGVINAASPFVAKGVGKVLEGAGKSIGYVSSLFNKPKTPAQIKLIEEAAEEIGAKATPGQLMESKLVQKLESKISQQTGRIGGTGLRSQIEGNIKAAKDAAENIVQDASGKTNYEMGTSIKDKLKEAVSRRVQVASAIYDKWENILTQKYDDALKTLEGEAAERSSMFLGAAKQPTVKELNAKNIYSPNISNLEKTINGLYGSSKLKPEAKPILNKYRSLLENVNTFEDLKQFRSAIGDDLASPNIHKSAEGVLISLYASTTNLRNEAIEKAAQAATTPADKKLFKTALDEIKDADAIYSSVSKDLKNALYGAKNIKTTSPEKELAKWMEKTPETEVVENILRTNDPKRIMKVRDAFPDIFENLRQGKIEEIVGRASKAGEINPKALAKIVDKMEPETATLVFGKDAYKKAKALKVFLDSVPEKLGQSGTPEGLEFVQLFNPGAQIWTITVDSFRKLISETPLGKDILSKTGRFMQNEFTTGATQFGARQFFETPAESQYRINQQKRFNIPENAFQLPKGAK